MEEDQQAASERIAKENHGAVLSPQPKSPPRVGDVVKTTESTADLPERAYADMGNKDLARRQHSSEELENRLPSLATDEYSTDAAQPQQQMMKVNNISRNAAESYNAFDTILAAGQAIGINTKEISDHQATEPFDAFSDPSMLPEATLLHPLENGTSFSEAPYLESTASIAETEGPRIQAFAKLEFDDMVHYMSTYSVEIGRDTGAEKLAMQQDLELNQEPEVKARKRSTSSGEYRQASRNLKREESWKIASSVVSESGGIMGPDMHIVEPRRKLKSKKSKSTSSSSYIMSRRSSSHIMAPQLDHQRAIAPGIPSTYGAHPVDTSSLLPSPEGCPFIKIHPPTIPGAGTKGYRGISRMHAKIAYNFEKRLFEIKILGRNGAFVDEQHYREGEVQELKSGSYIQIGGVGMKFVLPDVALGETGAEGIADSDGISGGAMSFDFEDGRGESVIMADSSETSSTSGSKESSEGSENEDSTHELDRDPPKKHLKSRVEDLEAKRLRGKLFPDSEEGSGNGDEEDDDVDVDDDEEEEEEEEQEEEDRKEKVKVSVKQKSKPRWQYSSTKPKPKLQVEPIDLPPKRRGPGRPPKNGIRSKREEAAQRKLAREAAKVEALKHGVAMPAKGKEDSPSKVGKLGKDDERSSRPEKTEKRKYTKRKKVEIKPEEPSGIRESIEKAELLAPEQSLVHNAAPKPSKEKRPPKPPRTPSPVWDITTLTAEQIAKPAQSYVVLIHEALSNSPIGAMSLPQIYRAIERRYPFFKLKCTTQGWQSSVRHNLSQHAAFRKITRDGKGWMWGLDPEISIEKEKKRRSTPPPVPAQGYYPPAPHYYHNPYGHPGIPLSNGHGPNGYPPYPMHVGIPPVPGQPMPLQHHGPPRGPNALSLPFTTPLNNTNSTYQSPYQPPPPPSSQQSPAPPPATPSLPPPSPQKKANKAPPEPQLQSHAAPSQTQQSQPQSHHRSPSPTFNLHQPVAHRSSPSPQPQPKSNFQAVNPPPDVGPDVLAAISKFKSALIASIPSNPNAEEIVSSAINRTLGVTSTSTAPGDTEYPEEKPIMQALSTLLDNMREKKSRSAGQAAQKAPAPPAFHGPTAQQHSVPPPPPPPQPPSHTPQPSSHNSSRPSGSSATQQAQLLSFIQQLRGPLATSLPQASPSDLGLIAKAAIQESKAGVNVNGIIGGGEKESRGVKRALEEDSEEEEEEEEEGLQDEAVGAAGVGSRAGTKRVAV